MPSSSSSTCFYSSPIALKLDVKSRDQAAPLLQAQADKKEYARCLSLTNDTGSIAAVHPDQAAEALAATGDFPALSYRTPAAPTALTGAWAARQGTAPCTTLSTDADDVLPKAPAPAPARPLPASCSPRWRQCHQPGRLPHASPCPAHSQAHTRPACLSLRAFSPPHR